MNALAALLLRFGARLLSARTRRTSGALHRSQAKQSGVLKRLLAGYARSRRGRTLGLEADMDYEAFREAAPIVVYEDLGEWIDRMRAAEPDQLWPGMCKYFAVSSGTTAGPSKYLPVNEPMLEHFRRAGFQSLLLFTARTGRASVFDGRHLFLGGATALQRLTPEGCPEVLAGDLSGITAAHLPSWAEQFLYEPGLAIAHIEDWPRKIEAIVHRTWQRDIRLVAGIPSWMLVLFEKLQSHAKAHGVSGADLRAIWPNLQCLVHGGVPVEPYVSQLRGHIGDAVELHEVFPASEGFIAAQDRESGAGLRLLDDAGLFFEFLPLADLDASGGAKPGAQALPAIECTTGCDYALVLSTPAGLCRYLIGDVVRFVSIDPPRILYTGRTRLQLSAFGEHVIEKELTDVVVATAREMHFDVAHFHVAPLFADTAAGRMRGAHEWWIETSEASATVALSGPAHETLVTSLDRRLQAINDDYAGKRRGGGMSSPTVHLVAPGLFEAWLRARGKWGGQNKMPRCRSDRAIADELRNLNAGRR